MDDLISRQQAIDVLWKALYEYEDKTAKKFQESEDLDIQDWIEHRIFVQNMNDIDRQTILNLPPAQPEPHEGYWIRRDCGLDVECKCSKCGYRDFVEPRDEYWFKRNYCPNCGAKMINK